jgi:hypothetical protein
LRTLVLSAFLLLCLCSFSQKLAFDIFLFGNKIGQTTVEKKIKNDSITHYMLNSASEARVFFVTRKIGLYYDIIYKNDQLVTCFSKSTRNEELHVTNIRWLGNKYRVDREDGSFNILSTVTCSTIILFFEEPCDGMKVFSERMGEYRYLKKIEPGVYEAEMQDGITYFYRYVKGKLIEMELRKGVLGSVFLRPH